MIALLSLIGLVFALVSDAIASINVHSDTSLSTDEQVKEWRKGSKSPAYFIDMYCHIYDSEATDWIPFKMWKGQFSTLSVVVLNQLIVILKARQLGLTWLMLGYALWLMLFNPIANVLLFSRRDDEAQHLLERLKGMYERLPEWMQAERVITDNDHVFQLSNGSVARAFPTSAGDSYTATFALVDEADLIDDLGKLLNSVKPTIDAGGKLVLLSRSNKSKPQSRFKKIYRAAKAGLNKYAAVFLSWDVRPGRTQEWYDEEKRSVLETTGSLDDVYEQYPATDAEALAPSTLDKRIPAKWLEGCTRETRPIDVPDELITVPGLRIYKLPENGGSYVAGADCAEGLPTSDDSVTTWVDKNTGEQMAVLAGKFMPENHAYYSVVVSSFYNHAPIMPENNNHGWTYISWLRDNSRIQILTGHIDKPGWSSTTLGKAILYNEMAQAAKSQDCIIHDQTTFVQLESIEKSTLRAPDGEMDDHADAYALALVARAAPTEETYTDDSARVTIGW